MANRNVIALEKKNFAIITDAFGSTL